MYIKNILIIIHLYSEMELFPLFSFVRQFPIVLHHSLYSWKKWNSFFYSKFPKTPFLSLFSVVEYPSPIVENNLLNLNKIFPVKEGYSFLLSNTIDTGEYPHSGNLSQLSDKFQQFSQFVNIELSQASPMKGGFPIVTSRAANTSINSL
jgi:hypothetical protein